MIGLDTNVLLRLFVEDDPAQSDARAAPCRRGDGGASLASSIPSCLPSSLGRLRETMKQKRAEVARLIEEVLSADDLEFLIAAPWSARSPLTARGHADFPDYFLAEINAELGCASDRDLRSRAPSTHPAFSLRAVSSLDAPIP